MDTPISRRGFLRSSGSLSVAALSTRFSREPQFARRGRALLVIFGDSVWTIDPALYSDAARAGYADAEDGSYTVFLRGAVLPGTDFDASFEAQLRRQRRGWQVHMRLPAQGFVARGPFEEWLQGTAPLEGPARIGTIGFAGGRFQLPGGRPRLSVSPGQAIRLDHAARGIRIDGPVASVGAALTLEPQGPSADSLRASMHGVGSVATAFTLHAPTAPETPVALGTTHCGRIVGCRIEAPRAVSGELFDGAGAPQGVLLVEGAMRVSVDERDPASTTASQVRLESGALSVGLGTATGERALAGRVSRAFQVMEAAGTQFTIAGDDEEPLYLRARGGGAGELRVRARLSQVWVPVPGATGATITLPERPVELLLSRALSCDDPPTRGRIILAGEPFAIIDLGGAKLNLRRGTDLLNVTLGFTEFDFRIRDGNPWLVRRRPESSGDSWPKATITVTFPPQHVAETVFPAVSPKACVEIDGLERRSRARLSAPSRLVFALQDGQWEERPMTVEALTEWHDLALQVHDRAMEPDVPVGTQLEFAQVAPGTHKEELRFLLPRQLTAPTPAHTALVMTSRLVVSPSGTARWSTPRGPLDREVAPLWHARLDRAGRNSVRAIWSDYLRDRSFRRLRPGTADAKMMVLEAADHWDIVGQSSVYGLPALRRIGKSAVDESSVKGPPVLRTLGSDPIEEKQPRSRVVRVPGYVVLEELDRAPGLSRGDVGFAIPTPFDDADIILTGIGGSFVADWRGEPPNVRQESGAGSFSLEKLQYRSHLGRDIRVEAVHKGYMFPLGIRCSFVTLTERRFILNPNQKYPTAFLVKRQFLLFGKPDKTYPGVHQPFEGRDFPAGRVRMLTRRTPDLVLNAATAPRATDPVPSVGEDGRLHIGEVDEDGREFDIFWPRTTAPSGGAPVDVEFSWAIDDDPTPVVSNLLFVENRVMARPQAVQKVVEYYRQLNGDQSRLRTARLGGARRRYAPAAGEGDTSFDTDSWLMSARGRLLSTEAPPTGLLPGTPADPITESELFAMDGRMEGSDQPPCYPVVEETRVSVQSLDRLLGHPQGLITAGFTPAYVRNGFDAQLNPSEIFLSVLGPDITLDVTGQGESAGGVAKPNALVVALSRKTGPIGGRRAVRTQSAAGALAGQVSSNFLATRGGSRTTTSVGVEGDYDFTAALKGQFDPSEFLGGLGNAKLLGLIPLASVLKVIAIGGAPRLLEQVAYGPLRAAQEAIPAIVGALDSARLACKGLTDAIEAAAREVGVAPEDLYPALYAQAEVLKAQAALTIADLNDTGLPALARAAGPLVAEGKGLLRELERVLADPLPAVIQTTLSTFGRAWTALRNGVNAFPQAILTLAKEEITKRIAKECDDAVHQLLVAELLGTISLDGPEDALLRPSGAPPGCADILRHPGEYLQHAERSLYSEVFARSVRQLLVLLGGDPLLHGGWPQLPEEQFRAAVRGVLVDLANAYEERLTGPFAKADLDALSDALTKRMLAEICGIAHGTPPKAAELAALGALLGRAAWVAEVVQANTHRIPAKAGEDLGRLAVELARDVRGRVEDAARQLLAGEVERLRREAATEIREAQAELTRQANQFVEYFIEAGLAALELASVARAGLEAWCNSPDGPRRLFRTLDLLAQGLAAPDRTLGSSVASLSALVARLPLPPATTRQDADRVEAARASVSQAVASVQTALRMIEQERKVMAKVVGRDAGCTDTQPLIRSVRRLLNLRIDTVDRLRDVADRLQALERLATGVDLVAVLAEARKLLGGVTIIDAIAGVTANGGWADVQAEVKVLVARVDRRATAASILQSLDAVDRMAAKVHEEIEKAESAGTLVSAADQTRTFIREGEKQLLGAIARAVVPGAERLETGADAALKAVAGKALSLHAVVTGHTTPALTALLEDPIRSLIHPNVIEKLRHASDAIAADEAALRLIVDDGPDKYLGGAKELLQRWKVSSGLGELVRTLGEIADAMLRGDIGALVNLGFLREQARLVESQVRAALQELVPSSIRMNYEWQTAIGSFPNGGDPIFTMQDSSPADLTLSADIHVDVIRNTREAVVKGSLRAFSIRLVGPAIPVATINFAGASFESRNGSAPKFRAQISGVEPGELIKFLEPLKPWMSPSGNGFYVRPVLNPPAIEAGYGFASDVIALGPVQFMNVALDVSARLPFTDHQAEFRFSFASPERPFLIVAPPYGGGGYLSLVASAGRIVEFRLSFVFGAAAPIKFGPLRAQGRVVAGMFIIKTAQRHELGALVEAVGEGNIACFGVSVCLRVQLKRNSADGNELRGSAEYSFKFKLGLVSYRYRFTAGYSARNDKGAPVNPGFLSRSSAPSRSLAANFAAHACPPERPDAVHRVVTPMKYRNWNQYCERIAMELL